ncbi:MAG: AtpZ/AtpI family protein [Bacteroidetes bacterium]|nr:AtpZ/AtpI family protein [Bacteroidota bacterium]
MKPEKPKQLNSYARYSSLATQMAVIIGGGCYGGYKLDQYFRNTTPVYTIILSLVSIAIALYLVLKDFIKPDQKK